jgi:Acetyltransferase (GNAT) domain
MDDRVVMPETVHEPTPTVRSPPERSAWLAALESSTEALAFHTPNWIASMCESDGYADVSRLYEFPEGRRLVLPLVRRRTAGPIATAASLPYGWGFGGPVGPGAIRPDEAAIVITDLVRGAALRTSVRPNPVAAAPSELPHRRAVIPIHRSAHVLNLNGDFERVERGFSSSGRRNVRKAERSSLTVEGDSSGRLVSAFYELYSNSAERWTRERRLPSLSRAKLLRRDPLRKFEIVARRMGDACRIWVAWVDERPAAAIIVLRQGVNASYWRGAMDRDLAAPTRANFLLHSLAIEDACRTGCRYYHMGETSPGSSLAQFKAHFGAEPYPYVEYRLERLSMPDVRERLRRARRLLHRKI